MKKNKKPRIEINDYRTFELIISMMSGLEFHRTYAASLTLTTHILARHAKRQLLQFDRELSPTELDNLSHYIRKGK